jgi:hypothetical protein
MLLQHVGLGRHVRSEVQICRSGPSWKCGMAGGGDNSHVHLRNGIHGYGYARLDQVCILVSSLLMCY